MTTERTSTPKPKQVTLRELFMGGPFSGFPGTQMNNSYTRKKPTRPPTFFAPRSKKRMEPLEFVTPEKTPSKEPNIKKRELTAKEKIGAESLLAFKKHPTNLPEKTWKIVISCINGEGEVIKASCETKREQFKIVLDGDDIVVNCNGANIKVEGSCDVSIKPADNVQRHKVKSDIPHIPETELDIRV